MSAKIQQQSIPNALAWFPPPVFDHFAVFKYRGGRPGRSDDIRETEGRHMRGSAQPSI